MSASDPRPLLLSFPKGRLSSLRRSDGLLSNCSRARTCRKTLFPLKRSLFCSCYHAYTLAASPAAVNKFLSPIGMPASFKFFPCRFAISSVSTSMSIFHVSLHLQCLRAHIPILCSTLLLFPSNLFANSPQSFGCFPRSCVWLVRLLFPLP